MRQQLSCLLLLTTALLGCAFGQDSTPRLDALKKYVLEKDYPEVFANKPYKTRIESVLDIDIDNDGSKEIVVLYFPHYRQSAPIVIYKINSDLNVTKVTEGLAPGPVQKVSGDYLDSHELGMAVDIEGANGDIKLDKILKIAEPNKMSGIVIYDSFFHLDGRSGTPAVVDMRGIKLPTSKHDCSSFEFSRVKQIAAGPLREDPSKNYLAAWVGNEIYVYLISGISQDGMLNKKQWVVNAPQRFSGFEAGQGLTYKIGKTTAVLNLK